MNRAAVAFFSVILFLTPNLNSGIFNATAVAQSPDRIAPDLQEKLSSATDGEFINIIIMMSNQVDTKLMATFFSESHVAKEKRHFESVAHR